MNRSSVLTLVAILALTGCTSPVPEPTTPPVTAPSDIPVPAEPIVAPEPLVDSTCDELLPTIDLGEVTLSAPIAGPQYLSEWMPGYLQRQLQWTSCSWHTESTDSSLQSLVSLTVTRRVEGERSDDVTAVCFDAERVSCLWRAEVADGLTANLSIDGAEREKSSTATTKKVAALVSEVEAAIAAAPHNTVWFAPADTIPLAATCARLLPEQAIAEALGGKATDVVYTDLEQENGDYNGYLSCEFSSSFTKSFGAWVTALEGGEWAWLEEREKSDAQFLEVAGLDEGDAAWIADGTLQLIVGHNGITITVPDKDFGTAPHGKDAALASLAEAVVANLKG